MTHAPAKQPPEEDEFVPWRELLESAYMPTLTLVCLAVWLHAADGMIVATMLPTIVEEIGGRGLVGWSVSLYEIASVVAGAASALLTMKFGLKLPMGLAALTFGFGCFVSAFAPAMPIVLLGRIFQGIGGGGLVAMSFVAIGAVFPKRYTARAMAAVSTFWGLSSFLGPLVGAFFVEYATWRWGFAVFGLQALGLAIWISRQPDHSAPSTQGPDVFPFLRLLWLCAAVLLVSYGGVEIDPLQTTLCVLLGISSLMIFFRMDSLATADRLFPLGIFDLRTPTGSALMMILSMTFAAISITAFGPLLLTMVHDVSALTAGYIIACSSVGWSVMSFLVSSSPARLDRLMIATGMSLVVISVIGFVYAVPNGPIWLVALFAIIEGGGFGMAWVFILRRTTSLADREEVQRISGAIPTVQRLGYALGAAYIGIVANSAGLATMQSAGEAAEAARWIFIGCLPFALFGLFAMVAHVRKPPTTLKTL